MNEMTVTNQMNQMTGMDYADIKERTMGYMMPMLRPSYINGMEINTVNARDLWSSLGGKGDFTSWMKRQLQRARLLENRDFIVFIGKDANPSGGRPTTEYFLTLDAGKHIAMLSGTEMGYAVREYFIACEQKVLEPALPDFTNPAIAARAWADEVEKGQKLQLENKQQAQTLIEYKPKADFVNDVFVPSEGSLSLGDFGRILCEDHHVHTGPRLIFTQLRTLGIMHKVKALPYINHIRSGHFKIKETLKNGCAYATAYLTPKGQLMVHSLLKGEQ